MISRGERGSRPAWPQAPPRTDRARVARGNGFGGLIARTTRLRYNAGGARLLFERQPNGVLNGKALRGGKPLGERFGRVKSAAFCTIAQRLTSST